MSPINVDRATLHLLFEIAARRAQSEVCYECGGDSWTEDETRLLRDVAAALGEDAIRVVPESHRAAFPHPWKQRPTFGAWNEYPLNACRWCSKPPADHPGGIL